MLLYRGGEVIRKGGRKFEQWRKIKNSRQKALSLTDFVVRKKGRRFVDNKLRNEIKKYSGKQFGSSSYWPWLALYTEIRGEFVEGWIPDDYYQFSLMPSMNPESLSALSTVKSFDHKIFGDFCVPFLGASIHGQLYGRGFVRVSFDRFKQQVEKDYREIVLKWDGGASGKSIRFIGTDSLTEEDFSLDRNCVIQPSVKQHRELQRFSAQSVNTIRIVTMIKNKESPELIFASLKFGTGDSRVDNVGENGRFLCLDDKGKAVSGAYDQYGFLRETHSEFGNFRYRDVIVPSFEKAVEKCAEAHCKFPYIGFVAWDVAIDEDGTPRLIEWNAKCPGMWVNEAVAGPVLRRCL